MERGGAVYILTNKNNTTLYIGVSSNLITRIAQHKNKELPGFTLRYNLTKLVYYEGYHQIEEAIEREKQMKRLSRNKKIELINRMNPQWRDLFDTLE